MKTQTKIAAIFFMLALSIMLILTASVYFFTIRYSFADFYKRLEIRGVITAKSTLDNEQASVQVLQEVRELHLERLPEEKEYFFEITPGKTFEKEAAELNLPLSFFTEILTEGKSTFQEANTFFAGLRYEGAQGTYAVVVSADNYYNSHHLKYLRSILLIGIVATALLTLTVSIVFSKQVWRPVKVITKRVTEISSENLHLRLQPTRVNDEISELETTFNHMLDRLETSFETQNNFISNASHELTTPLTTIIGEADVTLSKRRSPEEYVESLRVILQQAEQLENVTKSLLFLAQTGFKGRIEKFSRLRADQLLWAVTDTIEKMNPKNKVNLNLSLMPENPEKLKIMGVEQLLRIALSNIVSNGCKYSNSQPVTLSIGTTDHQVVIIVSDTGIGIPSDELKYIYDPFFRASNARTYEGYGIGLPLTRNIIRMHNGEIHVTSRVNEGTTVQVTFPIGPPPTLS